MAGVLCIQVVSQQVSPYRFHINFNKFLFVADNISKYYLIDINSGNLIWSKNSIAPFNSQIKTYNDMFFIIDFNNVLRCLSIKDGSELWNVKGNNTFIKSQKKLLMM